MQCRLPRMQTMISNKATLKISGTFWSQVVTDVNMVYITVDGVKYTSPVTLTVRKNETTVKVWCGPTEGIVNHGGDVPTTTSEENNNNSIRSAKIKLNGVQVAAGEYVEPYNVIAASYTFVITDDCDIKATATDYWYTNGQGEKVYLQSWWGTATITMPA